MSGSARETWDRLQHGWPVSYPLVQFPNAPLLVSFAGSAVHRLFDGDVADYGTAVARIGLAIWAWLELTAGVNVVRRIFGIVGLVVVAHALATA